MDRDIGKEVVKLSNRIKRRMRADIEEMGVTDAQSRVIQYIAEESQERNVYQKDIEMTFDVRRSSVTQLLQGLEREGLLVREQVTEDARLKKLTLTEKGFDVHNNMKEKIAKTEEVLSKNISLEEREMFLDILYKIRKNLREEKC